MKTKKIPSNELGKCDQIGPATGVLIDDWAETQWCSETVVSIRKLVGQGGGGSRSDAKGDGDGRKSGTRIFAASFSCAKDFPWYSKSARLWRLRFIGSLSGDPIYLYGTPICARVAARPIPIPIILYFILFSIYIYICACTIFQAIIITIIMRFVTRLLSFLFYFFDATIRPTE